MTPYPVRLPYFRAGIAAALLLAFAAAAHAQQDFGQAPPGGPPPPPAGNAGYPDAYPPPGGNMPGGIMPGGNMPGGNMPGGNMPGGNVPGGNLPGGMPGGAGPSPAQAQALQAMIANERRDYGVPPQDRLQTNLHGPTPTSIPGGKLITTDGVLSLYQQSNQNGLIVFHVLGPGPTLPNAQNAAPASQPGSFDDQTQQQFGQYLQQVTQGNRGRPLVFYCQSTQCWMSYNAALRAIRMGFTQVYWYRGGIEAWQQMEQLSAGGRGAGGGYGQPTQDPRGGFGQPVQDPRGGY